MTVTEQRKQKTMAMVPRRQPEAKKLMIVPEMMLINKITIVKQRFKNQPIYIVKRKLYITVSIESIL